MFGRRSRYDGYDDEPSPLERIDESKDIVASAIKDVIERVREGADGRVVIIQNLTVMINVAEGGGATIRVNSNDDNR